MNNIFDRKFNSVNGVDVEAGLIVCNNNMDLYKRMLGKFAQGYHDFPSKFFNALAKGDNELVKRLVHNLKGTSGSIGAKLVQGKAEILELVLIEKESVDVINCRCKELEAELRPLINDLLELSE